MLASQKYCSKADKDANKHKYILIGCYAGVYGIQAAQAAYDAGPSPQPPLRPSSSLRCPTTARRSCGDSSGYNSVGSNVQFYSQPLNSFCMSDRRKAGSSKADRYLHSAVKAAVQSAPGQVAGAATAAAANRANGPGSYRVSKPNVVALERKDGDRKWQDASLAEWDPNHYRLFVGNLSPDVTESVLEANFRKYTTLAKVKIPADKAGKSKGYGFVAFSSPDDYFNAFKDMNGKYVGLKPIHLKRSTTNLKKLKKVRK